MSSLALYAELEKEDVREIISGLGTFLQVIKDESDMLNSIIWQQNENLDGYDDEGENFDELNSQHPVDQDEAN